MYHILFKVVEQNERLEHHASPGGRTYLGLEDCAVIVRNKGIGGGARAGTRVSSIGFGCPNRMSVLQQTTAEAFAHPKASSPGLDGPPFTGPTRWANTRRLSPELAETAKPPYERSVAIFNRSPI